MNKEDKYFKLTFAECARVVDFPRFRRLHKNLESALATAETVRKKLADMDVDMERHQPYVFGPVGLHREWKAISDGSEPWRWVEWRGESTTGGRKWHPLEAER